MQSFVAQKIAFSLVGRLILHIVIGREKEATRTTGRVAHRLANLRTDAIHHSLDERTRCEILSCATLLILSVLFQNALIYSTLHVSIHNKPLLLVNHGDNLLQIDRFVNFVLRFGVDGTDKVVLLAEYF